MSNDKSDHQKLIIGPDKESKWEDTHKISWKCGLIIGCEFSAREKSGEGSSGKDFTCFGPPNFQNQPPPTAPLLRRARVFGLIIHKEVLETSKSPWWSMAVPDTEDLLRCESARVRTRAI